MVRGCGISSQNSFLGRGLGGWGNLCSKRLSFFLPRVGCHCILYILFVFLWQESDLGVCCSAQDLHLGPEVACVVGQEEHEEGVWTYPE